MVQKDSEAFVWGSRMKWFPPHVHCVHMTFNYYNSLRGKRSMGAQNPSFFFPLILFFPFIFIRWRLITLQYCSGFCHTLTWISHGFTCIPHPDPPSLPFSSIAGKTLWHAGLFLSSNLSCHSVRGGKAKRVCLSRAIDTLVVLPLLFQNPILDTYRGLPPSSGQCPSASLPWNLGKCDNPYGRIHKRGSFYP